MRIDKDEKALRAEALFVKGYNCAQAVAAAYAGEMGMDERQALRLASGFGAGMGGLRGACGAISGMILVYGMLRGYDQAEATVEKKAEYTAIQRMAGRFREKQGDLHCRALLVRAGIDPAAVPGERTAEYYQKRPCASFIRECAVILADELNEDKP